MTWDAHRTGYELGQALGRAALDLPEGETINDSMLAVRGVIEGIRAVCPAGKHPGADEMARGMAEMLRMMWSRPSEPAGISVEKLRDLELLALAVSEQAPPTGDRIAAHVMDIAERVVAGRTFDDASRQRLVDAAIRLTTAIGLPVDSDDPRFADIPTAPCVSCGKKTRGLAAVAWEGMPVPAAWCSHGQIWICYRNACLQTLDDAIDFAQGNLK